MLPSDFFMSNLYSQPEYFTGKFNALLPIVTGVFGGAVD